MPVLVPTPEELAVMPTRKRDEWLARMPVREVVREVPVNVPVPEVVYREQPVVIAVQTDRVVIATDAVPSHRSHRFTDADLVRCPLCGAWTLGVCRTGHVRDGAA